MTTIDRLCDEMNIQPDLLKIDVEGYELSVLRGSKEVLRECRPIIFLELHPAELSNFGHSPAELLSFLEELDYGFRNRRGEPADRARTSARWSHLVCVPS